MRIDYVFVEFHSPVFASGKNFGTKLTARDGIELWFDTDLRFMCMQYKGKIHDFQTWHSAERAEAPRPQITEAPKSILKRPRTVVIDS